MASAPGLAVVDVEVVAADPSGEEVLDLPVSVLGFGGYAGMADQFGHWSSGSISQLRVQTRSTHAVLRHSCENYEPLSFRGFSLRV